MIKITKNGEHRPKTTCLNMSFSFLFIEQDCLNCGYWTHTFRWYCSPRHEPMLLINDISTRHSKSLLFSRCVGLDQIGQQSRIWEHSQCKTTTARPFCVSFYQFLFDVVPTHQAIAGGKKPDARIRLRHFVLKNVLSGQKEFASTPKVLLPWHMLGKPRS